MSVKEVLLEQFTACYDVDGWFVALKNALYGVTAEQAMWKPEGANNSIWETLSHLNFYLNAYVQRFKGLHYEYPISNNDETFSTGDPEEWNRELSRTEQIMDEFRELISSADDGKFSEPVSADDSMPWSLKLAHINAHTAYHGGQILLLRKLQGAWDPSKGVS
jgi:uncharacterized damage-inducible protein DinB